jgi:hypothetical protein
MTSPRFKTILLLDSLKGTQIALFSAYCANAILWAWPRAGETTRDDVEPGIRIIGFERRVSIVFEVKEDEVIILGVYYGGREFDVPRY